MVNPYEPGSAVEPSSPQWSLVEMTVVVAICLLLYGLMLPATRTHCRQQSVKSSAAGR